MVQRKPTPEEQLLKLIEGGGAGAKDAATPSRERSPQEKSKGLKLGKIPGFLQYFKKGFSKGGMSNGSGLKLDIKTLNRALLGLVVASALFLAADMILFKPENSKFLNQVGTTDAVYPLRQGGVEKTSSDISVYKTAAQKRNPFLPPSAVSVPGAANSGPGGEGIPTGPTGTLAEALQGIKLVGISWSDNPLAMIEDVSTGRTFFVRKGQDVKGVKVQDISKEKVTVTFEGQESDLF